MEEAAGIGVLCADKTGTLTRNELAVMEVRLTGPFDEAHVLVLAALASSDGGADPVDAAIRQAAAGKHITNAPALLAFVAFDPAKKSSSATARLADGSEIQIIKGAYDAVAALLPSKHAQPADLDALQAKSLTRNGPPRV
nr:hypothetical protein [uncultured Rhodopila sp.]